MPPAKKSPPKDADTDTGSKTDDPMFVDDDKEPDTQDAQSHPFYCPGCGRRWNFLTECRGQSEAAPHAPIEVVSTDELDGDPADFTAAPDTA